ncbi:hypothetical protein SAMN05720354_107134 [Nitrosospira sp. Nsp1]|nr:hypothetical protein SAMN05720354_107134 [Nitrosospira sp. Nsp1]
MASIPTMDGRLSFTFAARGGGVAYRILRKELKEQLAPRVALLLFVNMIQLNSYGRFGSSSLSDLKNRSEGLGEGRFCGF